MKTHFTFCLTMLVTATGWAAQPTYQEPVSPDPVIRFGIAANEYGPVYLPLRATVQTPSGTHTRNINCLLKNGVASQALKCGRLGAYPLHPDTTQPMVGQAIYSVDFQGLAARLPNGRIASLVERDEPDTNAARAYWSDGWFWDYWLCFLEPTDQNSCISFCGGIFLIESLYATPNPANAGPNNPPDCDVKCECKDGTVNIYINDPPMILPDG